MVQRTAWEAVHGCPGGSVPAPVKSSQPRCWPERSVVAMTGIDAAKVLDAALTDPAGAPTTLRVQLATGGLVAVFLRHYG